MCLSSHKTNKLFVFLICQILTFTEANSQVFQLSNSETQWLGEQIFSNECGGNFECITSWNEGEEFPSLGIGHFIWYKTGQSAPFEETFPALLTFMASRNAKIPEWLETEHVNSPWESRYEFYSDFNSPKMKELREFLAEHRSLQVDFIIQRLILSLNTIISDFPEKDRAKIRNIIQSLINSHQPYGSYAVIDYAHFKGTGLKLTERYKNQGWGLRQILEKMMLTEPTLYSFVQTANTVLEARVINSPIARNEQRWLDGWQKRVETYLPSNEGTKD